MFLMFKFAFLNAGAKFMTQIVCAGSSLKFADKNSLCQQNHAHRALVYEVEALSLFPSGSRGSHSVELKK